MSQSLFCSSSLLTQVGCLLYVDGSIYASNFGTPTGSIVKIDLAGNATLIYKASAGIYFSTMVYVNGYFYITDGSSKIYKMDITGQSFTTLVDFTTPYNQGLGITYYAGNLYSCNIGTGNAISVVFKVNISNVNISNEDISTFITSSSLSTKLYYITVDNNGNFYITSNSYVFKYDISGTLLSSTFISGGFTGIYLYNNNFYISKHTENKIYQYDINGTLITNNYANGGQTYNSGGGMVFDNSGKFYVSNGNVSIQTIQTTITSPIITTFTGSSSVTDKVIVKFSGCFKPTQTGYWTFILGNPTQSTDDLGILFLGPAGTLITPNSSFSSLSPTLSNSTPILFNNYWQGTGTDYTYTYSTTIYLTAGLYYPLSLLFLQYYGDSVCKFSFFYGNYTPVVTTNLRAYLHLNNSSNESVSNAAIASSSTLTYRIYGGRTGVYCGGENYSAIATNFIQNVSINTLYLTAANGVSISLWVYPTVIDSNYRVLISFAMSTWNNFGFVLALKSSGIVFLYQKTGGYIGNCEKTGLNITANNWYHIVITFTGTNNIIYLNNVNQSGTTTNTLTTSINSLDITADDNILSIGTATANHYATSGGSTYTNFTGVISQVGIYNGILTSTDVNSLYTSAFSSSPITDFSSYIIDPIPDAPTFNSVNIANDRTVTISYTTATITGGADISTNYVDFSTSTTMDTISFTVDIGNNNGSYSGVVANLMTSTTYYIAIKSQNTGGYFSINSNKLSANFSGAFVAPTLNIISITPSTKTINLTYSTTALDVSTNFLYLSTSPSMDTNLITFEIGNTGSFNGVISEIVYGSVYYIAIKSRNIQGGLSAYSTSLGPYTMLSMTVQGLQWMSYRNQNPPYDYSINLGGNAIAYYYDIVSNYFGHNYYNYPLTSGTINILQIDATSDPGIRTFTNSSSTNYVGVKFSGFFIPNKTGSWTFNIGTPDDGAILYLGQAGKLVSDIIPDASFSGFSTAPNNNKPFLYNVSYPVTDTIGNTKASGNFTLNKNTYYPLLLYYLQYSSTYVIKLSVTDPSSVVITDLSGVIYNPLPDAPTLNNVTIVASSKTAIFNYTDSSYNGGYDIIKNTAYFSTNATMLDPSFNIDDIGKTGNYTSGVLSSIVYGYSYYVAIQAITVIGSSSYSNIKGPYKVITVPGAPTLTSIELASSKLVTITFTESTIFTGSDISYNYAYFSTDVDMSNVIINTLINKPLAIPYSGLITDLLYDTDYYVALKSYNEAGYSNYSNVSSVLRISNTSTSPYINSITSGNGKLTIYFSPPGSIDVSSSIVGYQYAINSGSFLPATPFTDISYVITTLSDGTTPFTLGTEYTIYLRVVTRLDVDNTLVYSTPVFKKATVYNVPTAPINVTISVDSIIRNQINVTYTTVYNGGSAYTGYSYAINSGGYIDIITTTLGSFSITGSYGSTYKVNVKLRNLAGTSLPSLDSSSVLLFNVPDRPIIYSATVGNFSGSIDLNFSIPNNNGNAITNYEYSTNSTLNNDYTSTGSTNTTYRIINTKENGTTVPLINGNSYLVRLRARNAAGPSLDASYAAVIPYTFPNAPTNVDASVTARSTTINVNWTTPNNNGNVITAYSYSINNNTFTTDQTPYTNTFSITGTIGLPYYVNVKVKNAAGYSDPTKSTTVIPYDIPSDPSFNTGVGNRQIVLLITKPNTNGSEIDSYEYSINSTNNYRSTGTNSGNITDFTITTLSDGSQLVNDTTYTIYLRAHNSAGYSGSTNKTATPKPTPNQPSITNNATIVGNGFIIVTFTAPKLNDGITTDTTIDYYEYSIDNGSTYRSTGSTSLTYTINGLRNGTPYTVSIRAHNSIGSGAPDSILATPYTIPSVPIINNIILDNQKITINITAPYNGGMEIDRYEYSIDNKLSYTNTGTSTTIIIQNLINQRTYTIYIRAHNLAGYSVDATTSTAPYYASISGTTEASSLALSGYISSLSNYTTVPNYYIYEFNKINTTIGTVNILMGYVENVSLYASYIIGSGTGFVINSDQRIKKNVEYLSSVKSFEFVNLLKPCSFQYVDFMKGTVPKYGYLAQDVEMVLPTIIYKNPSYIPNFYEIVRIEECQTIILTSLKTTESFVIGTKLKFYDIKNVVIWRKVQSIIDERSFTVTEPFPEGTDMLFLYGQEVGDLRSIDKDQITAVLLSAIQETNKRIVEQDREIDELIQITADLRKELDDYIVKQNKLKIII